MTYIFHQLTGKPVITSSPGKPVQTRGGTETPFSYWKSKNNYFYVMCLFYLKWPKNNFFINDISLSGAPKARFL